MRYLPILEINQQLFQIEFPDLLAIRLAEAYLTSSGAERDERFLACLLDSPMLLFWIYHSWKQSVATTSIEVTQSEMLDGLHSQLRRDIHSLVSDNYRSLSSVRSIEFRSFIDAAVFFDLSDKESKPIEHRLAERVVVVNYLWHRQNRLDPTQSGGQKSGTVEAGLKGVDTDAVLNGFEQTDFEQSGRKQSFRETWQVECNSFRNGFGVLDEKLRRLDQLENEFHEELERAKLAAMQQLAYGASHEVNNPLANISTRAQALLRDETDPKRRQRLMTIDSQAFRAHHMISNLMTFAKPRRPEPTRFQLKPVVERAVKSLQSTADMQKVEIRVDVDSGVYLEADAKQVEEILFALVENSIESIRQDGWVRIQSSISDMNQPAKIEVVDNGPGISVETRKHIFDPFFSGREAGRGLGFGLSKVWRLMELHQGKILVGEKEGLTCMELLFPEGQMAASVGIEKTA